MILVALALGAAWLGLRGARRDEQPVAAARRAADLPSEPATATLAPLESVAALEPEPGSARSALTAENTAPAAARDAQLALRVVAKESGAALADIHVVVHLAEASWRNTPSGTRGRAGEMLATDAEGRVEYELEPDQAYVLDVGDDSGVRAGRARQKLAPFAAGERRELVVALETALDLVWFARVLDGETNEPLAGARAARETEKPFNLRVSAELASDAAMSGVDGLVRLDAATWATSCARIQLPGYSPRVVVIEEGHELPSSPCNVLLYRAATLEVLARDVAGAPRAGLSIRLECESWDLVQGDAWKLDLGEMLPWEGHTDARGRCRFAELPARVAMTLELRDGAKLVRREERALRLEPGEEKSVSYTLGSGCRVLGRTVDPDGRPVAGVEVWLLSAAGGLYLEDRERGESLVAQTRSDDAGNFVLENVGAGTWRIGPAPRPQTPAVLATTDEPHSIAPVAQELILLPEQALASVTLTCWPGLYIGGRVVGPEGEKVQSTFVTAQSAGLTITGSTRGDEFLLGPLPAGDFTVRASGMFGAFADAEPVTVPAGTTDLVLRMRRGGGVDVTVLDPLGNPAAGVMVWVLNEAEPAGDLGMNTDEAGKIQLGGRLPGAYTISATSSQGEFACALGVQVRAEGGDAEVELRLEPGARLRIRVLPEVPREVGFRILQGGRLLCYGLGGGDPLVVVPEGELEVVLGPWSSPQEELARRTVSAVRGSETEVVFDLTPR